MKHHAGKFGENPTINKILVVSNYITHHIALFNACRSGYSYMCWNPLIPGILFVVRFIKIFNTSLQLNSPLYFDKMGIRMYTLLPNGLLLKLPCLIRLFLVILKFCLRIVHWRVNLYVWKSLPDCCTWHLLAWEASVYVHTSAIHT